MLNPLFSLKAPEGWEYCLGREEEHYWAIEGNKKVSKVLLDPVRMKELKDQGFTPVPSDRYPDLSDFHKDGYIKYRGLILLERLTEVGDKHRAVLNSRARTPDKVIADIQAGLDALSEKIDWEYRANSRKKYSCDDEDEKNDCKKFFIDKIIGWFKRRNRHYYASWRYSYPHSFLFPKTRKFIETIQYKFRFGKYKLDEEEKKVCENMDISEESYIKEKYKIEIDAIY